MKKEIKELEEFKKWSYQEILGYIYGVILKELSYLSLIHLNYLLEHIYYEVLNENSIMYHCKEIVKLESGKRIKLSDKEKKEKETWEDTNSYEDWTYYEVVGGLGISGGR